MIWGQKLFKTHFSYEHGTTLWLWLYDLFFCHLPRFLFSVTRLTHDLTHTEFTFRWTQTILLSSTNFLKTFRSELILRNHSSIKFQFLKGLTNSKGTLEEAKGHFFSLFLFVCFTLLAGRVVRGFSALNAKLTKLIDR